jgi:hypothetical protein
VTLKSEGTLFNVVHFKASYVGENPKRFHMDYFRTMIEEFVDSIDTSGFFGDGYPIEGLKNTVA